MKKSIWRGLSALIALTLLLGTVLPALAEDKKETVFVIANAAGAVDHIVVSERLYNPEGLDQLTDVSSLENIENVGGEETFAADGDNLVWAAGGADISYEGTSEAPLPVGVRFTYVLDGKEIAPEELKGKSGHLEIHIDYEAALWEDVEIGGETVSMPVPFFMATVMTADEDVYSNIQVTNGRVVDAGNMKAIVCFGLPGVREALDLDSLEDIDADLNIPESAVISADVRNYESSGAYTIATNSLFGNLLDDIAGDKIDESALDDLDIQALVDEARDAADQLLDGVEALDTGAGDLLDGAGKLSDGATELSEGLDEIDANSGDLTDGAKKVFESVLDSANEGLAAKKDDLPNSAVWPDPKSKRKK